MYRSSPAIDELEIDHVLRRKRNQNEAKACIPCRRRKVRCDKSHPCNTCWKRGHPLICVYDLGHQSFAPHQSAHRESSSTARHRATSADLPDLCVLSGGSRTGGQRPENASTENARRRLFSISAVQEESAKDYIFSGDNSIASIIQSRAQQSNCAALELDIGPVLGLQNTFGSYPFMDLESAQNRWAMLLKILPHRNEVLKFFQIYKSSNYLFTPILVDIDQFELELCSYLNAHAAGEFQGQNPIAEGWVSGKSLGFISLVLAVLAAGAHFSDIENPERSSLCQDFEQRSFQALRLANFLFRPSSDIIQTLLILGSTLQNNGQSDAAWAMLGTTVRLAQTLGFHTERSMTHLPERLKFRARKCWSNIVWQDALLSLCHDRPPVTSRYFSMDLAGDNLSYADITDFICRLSLKVMAEPEAQDISHSVNALARMDNAYRRAQPHLQARENCKTFHQHLECLALKMHISLCVSYICRPAIRRSHNSIKASDHDLLRRRAKESLIQASKVFLDFQALSTVPLRSWSMVHTALSSTLLLCIWEETRNDSECRDLQQRVTEVFAAAEPKPNDDPSSASASESWQWLSERHARALVTLRNAFSSENGLEASTNHDRVEPQQKSPGLQSRDELNPDGPNETPPFEFDNQLRNTFDYDTLPNYGLATDRLGLMYTSPISYLDSIMNVPFFDFSQDSEFL